MTPARAASLLDAAEAAAAAAGALALTFFRTRLAVTDKGGGRFDPVTEADRAVERLLRARLAACLPGAAILGEEYGATEGGTQGWIIDPIDGTRAFMSGMLGWGILIGLLDHGRAVAGLMHQPFTGEFFLADPERGARYRRAGEGAALRVSAVADLAAATLYSTHPSMFAGSLAAPYQALAAQVRLHRYGGDCYGYAMLAAGHVDLVVEAGLAPYDIAPLVPIMTAAGGVVSRLDGGSPEAGGTIVAAATAPLHQAALAVLRARA